MIPSNYKLKIGDRIILEYIPAVGTILYIHANGNIVVHYDNDTPDIDYVYFKTSIYSHFTLVNTEKTKKIIQPYKIVGWLKQYGGK